MIENKVLVSLTVPSNDAKYDVYIPANRKIYSVIEMIKRTIYEVSKGAFDIKKDYVLYNAQNGMVYDMNLLVRDTDIRNGSMIIML